MFELIALVVFIGVPLASGYLAADYLVALLPAGSATSSSSTGAVTLTSTALAST